MSNSACHFKRDGNQKPILPKCTLDCHDNSREHRFKFYHESFGANKEARLKFLIEASNYSYEMKKKDPSFSGLYLWEQFSCDLRDEIYHKFLIHCYLYVMKHPKNYDDLMAIAQAVMTLEENAITGIYYLNVAFMMWTFKYLSLKELNVFLEQMIDRRVIYALYDIHFGNLLKMIQSTNKGALNATIAEVNATIAEVRDRLTQDMLKGIYAEFMLGTKYRAFGQQKEILGVERSILEFQKPFEPRLDSLSISNTGLMICITGLMKNSGYSGEFKSAHLM
jgi:hypothetical protein